jgi:hypothetical protein
MEDLWCIVQLFAFVMIGAAGAGLWQRRQLRSERRGVIANEAPALADLVAPKTSDNRPSR